MSKALARLLGTINHNRRNQLKHLTAVTFLLIVLSLFASTGSAQTSLSFGPEVTSASSNGFTGGSNQTSAGASFAGEFDTTVGLPIHLRMTGKIKNNLPYFDTTGTAFEMLPEGAMHFPLGGSAAAKWDIYTFGDASIKRAQSTTIMNPGVGFGVRRLGFKGGSEAVDSSIRLQYGCRFDDILDGNGLDPEVFREWYLNGQIMKRAGTWGGFYVQGGVRKRMNSTIIPAGYEVGGGVGIVLF